MTAAAPVPDFSRQSFGKSRLFGYLELSQRPSFWATCFLFIFDLSLSIAMVSVEDLFVPIGVALEPEPIVLPEAMLPLEPEPMLLVEPEDMLPVEEVELFIVPAEPLAVPLAPTLAFGFEVLSLLVEGVVEAL